MNFVLVGVNHKTAPVHVREKMNLDGKASQEVLSRLLQMPQVQEATVLSTCNRVELYSATEDPEFVRKSLTGVLSEPLSGLVEQEIFYSKIGPAAVEHLFSVTCSVDSQVTGENQITGQVKEAYQSALDRSATGYYLNKLFDRALYVAKRVRTETEISKGNVSVGSVGVMLAKKIFGHLQEKKVLLVGAGEIGELVLRYLINEKVDQTYIVNRTFETAQKLQREGLGQAVDFARLTALLEEVDVVLTSVSTVLDPFTASELDLLMQRRKNRPLFIVDLGVPRNVPDDVSSIDNLYVYNVDDLKEVSGENQRGRNQALKEAKNIIDQEVKLFYENHLEFNALPAIAQLGQKFEQIRQVELKKSLARLSHLSEQDQKAVDRLTQALMSRLLHDPILSLRNQKEMAEPAVLSIFKKLFRLDDEG